MPASWTKWTVIVIIPFVFRKNKLFIKFPSFLNQYPFYRPTSVYIETLWHLWVTFSLFFVFTQKGKINIKRHQLAALKPIIFLNDFSSMVRVSLPFFKEKRNEKNDKRIQTMMMMKFRICVKVIDCDIFFLFQTILWNKFYRIKGLLLTLFFYRAASLPTIILTQIIPRQQNKIVYSIPMDSNFKRKCLL